MKNVTKLAIWPELQKLGFERINYNSHGRLFSVGASLRAELTSVNGEKFKTDLITIEPLDLRYDKKCYHLTGDIKNPYQVEFYRYDFSGEKIKGYQQKDHMNDFFSARELLNAVKSML